jgi:hypothetical protein
VRRAALAAALLAACASSPAPDLAGDARRVDDDAVAALAAEIDDPKFAGRWIVVQDGEIAGSGSTPVDAVHAAHAVQESGPERPAPVHRYVFRPPDRGPREYRMAYLAEGGIVAGRGFLQQLGLETVGLGAQTSLRRKGDTRTAPLSGGRTFTIDVAAPGGASATTLSAVLDPDFDGTLVLPRAVALGLALQLFEIPGTADVQVALARPFRAHRAVVDVRIVSLGAAGRTEALFETAPLRK